MNQESNKISLLTRQDGSNAVTAFVMLTRALSHVYDGVSLDVVHIGVLEAQLQAVAMGRADDAGGDGVLQGEGASHRYHKLARAQV